MKKAFKIFVIILITVFMFGCNKAEGILTIDADKNVSMDIKIVVNKDFDTSKYLDNIEAYKLRKININKEINGDYVNYSISKKYPKIDDVSSQDDITLDLSKYLDSDFNDSFLFKKEDSYLKDKYYANFIIDNSRIDRLILNNSIKITASDFIKIVKDIYNNSLNEHKSLKEETTYTSEKNVLSINEDIAYSITVSNDNKVMKISASNQYYEYTNNNNPIYNDITEDNIIKKEKSNSGKSEIKFIVKLPNPSLSNNADEVSDNGKTLTWTYNNNRKNEIKFTFELENKLNYISVFGIGLLIIFTFSLLIFLSIKLRDKKREKIESEPVYKSEMEKIQTYEPFVSEETQTTDNSVNNNNNIPNINDIPVQMTEINNHIENTPKIESVPNIVNTSSTEETPNIINIDEN